MKRFFTAYQAKRAGAMPRMALPMTLKGRNVYIFPTRYGILFAAVVIGMLLGSVNHNNNFGFLLTFLLTGMGLVSIFHTYWNLFNIRIEAAWVQPVFASQTAVFEFILRLPSESRRSVGLSFADQQPVFSDLSAKADNRIQLPLKADARGILRPGPLVIHTDFPFGIFRAWSRLRLDLECLVYPEPLRGGLQFAPDPYGQETSGSAEKAGSDDFQGLRPYEPGDSLQHISWKTFSRGQGLFTKAFVGQSGASALLDWNHIGPSDVEHKLSLLCDMVLQAHRANIAYGLRLPAQRIHPASGEAHKRQCLKALALFPSGAGPQ